jgi:hypothetical protein
MIIAITAKARHGKDTLCNLLIEEFEKRGVNACRNSLAGDLIKQQLQDFFNQQGVDVYSEDLVVKELIRPMLKEMGIFLRKNTNNRYFVYRFEMKDCPVNIITDLRFYDELQWLHEEQKGVSIFLNRYDSPVDIKEENDVELMSKYCDLQFYWSSIDSEPKIGTRIASLVSMIIDTQLKKNIQVIQEEIVKVLTTKTI